MLGPQNQNTSKVKNMSLSMEGPFCVDDRDRMYRDRAAERRALHGGFGVGPGQKVSPNTDDSVPLDATADP
ncbi:hypothetical protein RND71_017743 [Anisodus tanguticus]|uniref:Uncharacterized protein n=1 Tax=Anisodus tanguticus TaxID=243964 RepID=A0AAE1S3E8_9SOLA|nr:hypothetical protein RND71_017743 [Anisodus tanguticus]